MKQISVVLGEVAVPIVDAVARSGANAWRLLEAVGLPPDVAENPERPMSLHRTIDLLELAESSTKDPWFTRRALQASRSHFPKQIASQVVSRRPTQFESIRAFVHQTNKLTTEGITLATKEDLFWVEHVWSSSFRPPGWQAEQYVIAFFETAFQQILRPDWHPAGLRVIEPRLREAFPDEWAVSEPILGSEKTAIAIHRRDLLQALRSAPETAAAADIEPVSLLTGGAEAANQVVQSVLGLMQAGETTLAGIADAFGLNPRTFQRRLADIGVRYSALLDEYRYRQATRALRETDISITDLAFELGYSHRGNLTRAFKRRIGVSPSAYRESLQK